MAGWLTAARALIAKTRLTRAPKSPPLRWINRLSSEPFLRPHMRGKAAPCGTPRCFNTHRGWTRAGISGGVARQTQTCDRNAVPALVLIIALAVACRIGASTSGHAEHMRAVVCGHRMQADQRSPAPANVSPSARKHGESPRGARQKAPSTRAEERWGSSS